MASVEGRGEACALTLMKMMVQSQVGLRTSIIRCEKLLHFTSTLPKCSTCECVCLQWRTRGEPSSLPALARVAWKVQLVVSAPPPQARDCLLLELWAILLILTPWQEARWVPIMANTAGETQVLCPQRLWSDKLEGLIFLLIVNSQ